MIPRNPRLPLPGSHAQQRHVVGHRGPAQGSAPPLGPFEPDRLLLEPEEDIDGFILHQAHLLLDRMPEDKPWALIVVLSGPGNDLPPPTLYDGLVDRKELATGFIPTDLSAIDVLAELDYPRIMLQRLEPRNLANIRSDYLGRVALIDHGLNKLATEIRERNDHASTWMVVASDRGHLLGEHGLVGHRSFLSGAVEVPFIIAPPEGGISDFKFGSGAPGSDLEEESPQMLKPPEPPEPPESPESPEPPDSTKFFSSNRKSEIGNRKFHDGLVSTVDVAATIAALGGCDLSPACVGRSLLPALSEHSSIRPIAGGCLSEFGKRLMLETERYKVVFNTDTLSAMGLYDLLNDPDERHNLVNSPIGMNLLDALRWRVGEALMPLRATPGGVG